MKLNFASVLLLLILPIIFYAQDSTSVSSIKQPNNSLSETSNIKSFTQKSKRFNDWEISIGAGIPLVQSADLTSIKNGNGKDVFGYSAYISVDKAITNAFGINLQYDKGETRQGWFNTKNAGPTTGPVSQRNGARTQYDAISLLGDINFSNLLRRIDNNSNFRWTLHGYAGIGTLAYRAYLKNGTTEVLQTEIKPFNLNALFGQAGAGLKFKINRRFDIETRVMYVYTGDDSFDGGGVQYSSINQIEDQVSDNFFNATLGLSLKLGKHESHLMWYDPMQEIYHKLDVLANKNQDVQVCKKGDLDNDGVCDDWDRQLDTPAGARVDGAGVALDSDLDGVIDLNDKCVMVPGPVENSGCPIGNSKSPIIKAGTGIISDSSRALEGIEFDLNSSRILPSNTPILNNAASVINLSKTAFKIIGGTDASASESYNQKLSEERANSVKSYLIGNGVDPSKLEAVGRGENDLKYPECNPTTKCPEWKNRANRRVYFETK
ncbi:OmpA family protein [Halpernia sp.]|uniref:OmpA family protein n=1 Tax=Halpernia sp. TaxID=2782209 RepID=UPI003A929A46